MNSYTDLASFLNQYKYIKGGENKIITPGDKSKKYIWYVGQFQQDLCFKAISVFMNMKIQNI